MIRKLSRGLGASIRKFTGKGKNLKKEIGALYLAYKRKDIPIYTKIIIMVVVAYALSPIDIIPDFIPVLGLLDDIIIVPLGIALAVRLIPKDVMDQCRIDAERQYNKIKKKSYLFAILIVLVWILIITYIILKIKSWLY
ncbi:DUF1232 domain-containing protein [Clostridium sp. YIM B02505]|uniref:DUF1232 domain-containing protein n=1 Tax=Clostridium yunnanense TaxID=2800325 RepID=A0ABS1ERW1_9CLOT|nr:YkvA family protein [Clostridium yunnanense]MBK1812087.1 DUF1232 domain-containing protein [Clostridium yunnanense]